MDLGSKEEDELNGGPILALEEIVREWRAWSRIHDIEIQRMINPYSVPNWNVCSIKEMKETLNNPAIGALLSCFKTRKITSDHESILSSLYTQYNFAYNPLAAAGTEIAKTVLNQAISPRSASWCLNTSIKRKNEDGLLVIDKCGKIKVRNLKTDVIVPGKCFEEYCSLSEGVTLNDIYVRQKKIDELIGHEQCFGVDSSLSKSVSELWHIAKDYVYIVDRYFKCENLRFISEITDNLEVRLLIADDDKYGKYRKGKLIEYIKKPL